MPFYASDMPWMNPSDVIKATGTEMTRLSSPLPDPRFTQSPVRGFTVPPNTQAVIPRMNMQPALSTTGGVPSTAVRNLTKGFTLGRTGQTISDAIYRELPKQRALPAGAIRPQIGYTPAREAITSQEALGNIRRFSKPYAQQAMEDIVQTAPKAAKGLSKVAKAGIGGAGGAVLTDMLFPDSANEIDDVAMINKYKPLISHGMTTPQAVGFPALQPMPNQAQAERDFRQTQETIYGKTPGTGYIQFDETGAYGGKQRKAGERLVFDNSTPLGGFGRSSTADADMARQAQWAREAEAQQRQALLQKEYEDAVREQQNFDSGARWALENPSAPGAAAYLTQLQQGRMIGKQVTPLSERQANLFKVRSEGEAKLIQAQAQVQQAIGSPEERILKQAQAELARAQAAGVPQGNAVKAAMALQKAKEGLAENETKLVEIAMASTNPAQTLTALSTQYPNLKRVAAALLAAEQMAKG